MSTLQKIRQAVIDRPYYFSAPAEEEMWAADLERIDIEQAILKGPKIFGERDIELKGQQEIIGSSMLFADFRKLKTWLL